MGTWAEPMLQMVKEIPRYRNRDGLPEQVRLGYLSPGATGELRPRARVYALQGQVHGDPHACTRGKWPVTQAQP